MADYDKSASLKPISGYAQEPILGEVDIQLDVAQRVLRQSFAWMSLALALSGAVGYGLMLYPGLVETIFSSRFGFIALFLVQLGVVGYLSARINQMSFSTALSLFGLYAALTGIVFGLYLMVFTGESVAQMFLLSSAMFGGCAVYGYTTKRNIMGWGSWLMVGLIGVIAVSIFNFFMRSELASYLISGFVVLLFSALTAYDTQKLMIMASQARTQEDEQRLSVLGALTLYLDFINIFFALMQIFGRRK